MPMHPRRPCRQLYCPAYATDKKGWCDKHRPKSEWKKEKPGGSTQRAKPYDKRHQLIRKAAFHRDNGLCQICLHKGYYTPASVAHHIKPAEQFPELMYSLENIQSLCRGCHEILHGRRRVTENEFER